MMMMVLLSLMILTVVVVVLLSLPVVAVDFGGGCWDWRGTGVA